MIVGINGAKRDITDVPSGINGAVRAASELWQGKNGATQKVWPTILPLNDYSWDEISDISASGDASNYFEIGDCKEITLYGTVGGLLLNGYTCYAYIIGFDHNASLEGTGLTHFQLAKTALSGGKDICFTDSSYNSPGYEEAFRMNRSNTNSGGWKDSHMRNSICGTSKTSTMASFMGAIPSALRNALKSVTKYTNNTGNSSNSGAVTATTDYFFLLAEYEVSGNIKFSNTYEANYQQQYAYYSAGNSKVKYRHNSTGSSANWWLRSPYASDSYCFVRVITSGNVNYNYAHYSLGFAPGFCV